MKLIAKLASLALLLGCMAFTFPKDDSNTVNPLPSNNSNFFSNNSNFLAKEDANRYLEMGCGNLVSVVANANACLGPTGVGLTMTPTSCIAYNAGFRGTEVGSITFPNNSTCWVGIDENTIGNNSGLPNFTRVSGTHYLTDCIDSTKPIMTLDSQLLMEVSTVSGSINGVTDLRNSNPSCNSNSGITIANLPTFSAQLNESSESLANNSSTILTFNTVVFDTGGFSNLGVDATKLTIPTGDTGIYWVAAAFTMPTNGTNGIELTLLKNGSTVVTSGLPNLTAVNPILMPLVAQVALSAGDYIQIKGFQNSGSSQTITGVTMGLTLVGHQ